MKGQYDDVPFGVPGGPAHLRARPRPLPRRLDRGSAAVARLKAVLRGPRGPRDLGRADPLGRRHRRPCEWPPRVDQREAVALRPAEPALRGLRPPARRTGSASTAGGRPSWGPGAGRSSTWPPSSTRTRPTTRPPRGYNEPVAPPRPPGQPPAGGGLADRLPLGGVSAGRRPSRARWADAVAGVGTARAPSARWIARRMGRDNEEGRRGEAAAARHLTAPGVDDPRRAPWRGAGASSTWWRRAATSWPSARSRPAATGRRSSSRSRPPSGTGSARAAEAYLAARPELAGRDGAARPARGPARAGSGPASAICRARSASA